MQYAKFLILLLILFVFASPLFAGGIELYVSNRLVGVVIAVKGTGYYISLEAIKKATNAEIQVDEPTGKVLIKGKSIEKFAIRIKGAWLVPVQEVGQALGYEYKYDKETQMIDLFKRSALILNSSTQQSGASYDPFSDEKARSRYINKGSEGQTIDINQYIVSGKTNLFCFYSDY